MRRRSLLAVAGLALVLAGCSGEEEATERPAAERLAAAKARFDAAKTVALDLSSRDVPPRENGVTAAKGSGRDQPDRAAVRGHHHGHRRRRRRDDRRHRDRRHGRTSSCSRRTTRRPTSTPSNAPNPATFFDPADGISALLPATVDPVDAGETRAGREVLSKVDGTLPGDLVEDLFHLGDGTGTFTVSYGLTDTDELRTATLEGPFFPGVEATYLLSLTDYGAPVEITRP